MLFRSRRARTVALGGVTSLRPLMATVRSGFVARMMGPFQESARTGALGGIVLFACTVAALAWANSRRGAEPTSRSGRRKAISGPRAMRFGSCFEAGSTTA